MIRKQCISCGNELTGDEISLYRKMVLRSAEEFCCLECLGRKLAISKDKLEELIAYYHRTGICSLFAKWDDEGNKIEDN